MKIEQTEPMLALLRVSLEKALSQAAEPIIQQALKDAEAAMRARVGTAVLALLERGYSVTQNRQVLEIRVDFSKLGPVPQATQ